MELSYLSLASGIAADTAAWEPLGWRCAGYAEIEHFPCRLLHDKYGCGAPENMPSPLCAKSAAEASDLAALISTNAKLPPRREGCPPNKGDIRQLDGTEFRGVNVLMGGVPCQDFSVAGKREGAAGDRGSLIFEYVRIADECNPDAAVLENVPGLLSDNGNAFGHFLAALAGCDFPAEPGPGPALGKSSQFWTWKRSLGRHVPKWPAAGWVAGPKRTVAWRVFDAQYFGLAQRRKRVFVVGCPRDGADPREILFEFDGVRRDTPPRRGEGQNPAPTIAARTRGGGGLGTDFDCDGGLIAGTLDASMGASRGAGTSPAGIVAAFGGNNTSGEIDVAARLGCNDSGSGYRNDFESDTFVVASTLRADGFDASEDGTGRQNLVVAFHGSQDPGVSGEVTHPAGRNQGQETCVMSFAQNSRDEIRTLGGDGDIAGCLNADEGIKRRTYVASVSIRGREGGAAAEMSGDVSTALRSSQGGSDKAHCLQGSSVRRLTPTECERLMGFPDGYTSLRGLKSWRDVDRSEFIGELQAMGFQVRKNKKGVWRVNDPDGPRYKTLGNSIAVPVLDWLGKRIEKALWPVVMARAAKFTANHTESAVEETAGTGAGAVGD